MTTGVPVLNPIPIFTDNTGRPAAGGSVLTQVASVNAPTYSDVGLTTPLPNPIPLNSRGEASISAGTSTQVFLPANTVYAFTVKDAAGNILSSASYVNGVQFSPTAQATGQLLWPQTVPESTASVTPTSFAVSPDHSGYDVRRTGAVGDGGTDCTAALSAANSVATAGGAALYFPPGTYRVASNLALSNAVVFDQNAILKPDAGVTITINAPVIAGPWRIFNLANAGALIRGTFQSPAGHVLFKWWGAACNGTISGSAGTDDSVAVQACFDALAAMGQGEVRLLTGEYVTLTTNILISGTMNSGVNNYVPKITGAGSTQCGFNYPALSGSPNAGLYNLRAALCVQVTHGFPGNYMKDCFVDFAMNGAVGSGSNGTAAVEIRHSTEVGLRGVAFNANQYGLILHNYTTNTWTEYVQAQRCFFGYNCLTALWYHVTSGNPSFKKSGLIESLVTNYGTGNPSGDGVSHPSVLIDTTAQPYQAPLDCSVAGDGIHAITALIQNNNVASGQTVFYGNLQTETGANKITLCAGSVAGYAGTWNDFTGPNSPGTLIFCKGFNGTATTPIPVGARAARHLTGIGAGTTAVGSALSGSSFLNGIALRLWTVTIVGTTYQFMYVVAGGIPSVAPITVATLQTFESGHAYGAPTFGCDASGNLTVTNANWPASFATIFVEENLINSWNWNVSTDYTLW